MNRLSVYHDLEAMKSVALYKAEEHNCNYNVIISRPLDGKFSFAHGSTYEFVADSYLVNRPETVIVMRTDDVLHAQQKERGESTQVVIFGQPHVGRSESLILDMDGPMHIISNPGKQRDPDSLKRLDKILEETREIPIVIDDMSYTDFPYTYTTNRGKYKPDNTKFYDRFYNKRRF